MDPDDTLARAVALADDVIDKNAITLYRSVALAQAVRDLNDWICGGGALPRTWRRDSHGPRS